MLYFTQIRKFFNFLLVLVLVASTAFGFVTKSALADSNATNEISNVKGDSSNINRSYHQLQEAAQDYRQEFYRGNNPKQAAKNAKDNTKNAFGRVADSVRDTLTSDKAGSKK